MAITLKFEINVNVSNSRIFIKIRQETVGCMICGYTKFQKCTS